MFKYILPFLFAIYLFGQENSDLKLIGHWGENNGKCDAVEVKGDTVFFVEGRGFKIVDYSDKTNPILISESILPNKNIISIIINSNYAYLLSAFNLIIVDISNTAQPVLVTQYEIICAANNFVLKDNLLFIVYGIPGGYPCNDSGCLILNVSDTDSIYERYNYKTNDNPVISNPVFDIAINDTTAYLSVRDSIIILNIAQPDSPKQVGQFTYDDYSSCLYIENNFLYAIYPFTGMSIFNIDDPYQLNLIGNLDVSGIKAKLHNNYLFIDQRIYGDGPDDSKIAIVDVALPNTPVKISEINMGDFGFSNNLAYSNNYLYVSHGSSGLYVVDVSNVINPVEVTRYKTGYKYDVALYNNYAYLASGYDGIQIVDITDMANLKLIGNLDLKEHPADRTKKVVIEGDILYLMIERYSDTFVNSIYLFDISDPKNPKILGSFNTSLMTDFSVRNKYMYLTGIYNFCVIDATDPLNPVQINKFSKGTGAGKDVKISGNYAFIGEWKEGLRIIDISDPMNLLEVANYTDFGVGDIYLNDKIAYIIAQSHLEPEYSLRILDISDFTSIKELGAVNLNSNPKCINFNNNKVVLGDGLKIIDVSDPENPEVIDSSNVCNDLNNIILNNKYIYAANGIDGLYIFQYDFLTSSNHDNLNNYSYKLYQNYPNPFNPITRIGYSIPARSHVTLKVYDLLGREVSTLVDKIQLSGEYNLEFNANQLSNGIYFYQLQTENYQNTMKCILLK